MSVGTKGPWGKNVRGQNIRLGHIYQGLARQYFLLRNLLSVKEKSANTYTLSVGGGGGGGKHVQHSIFIKTVYIHP
jgi:hypothetical protein